MTARSLLRFAGLELVETFVEAEASLSGQQIRDLLRKLRAR